MLMVFSLLVERKGAIPNAMLSLITATGAEDAGLDSAMAVSRLLLERESNTNNQKIMGTFDCPRHKL
jgi:nucleolar pre-ribosomal-associated protein 2